MQVVGYETAGEDSPATLQLAEDGQVSRETLTPGTSIDFGLARRHCAGSIDGDTHVSCSNDETPYCAEHTDEWPCARCSGNCAMPIEACHEEHVIYLAAFAPNTFKVGVTRSWRLDTRLREQGADRAATIEVVQNGRIARSIESNIATDLTDRVRIDEKIAGLHRSVDRSAWETVLGEYQAQEDFAFEYGLDLQRHPIKATLLSGSIRGSKGRILVLDRGGSTYAVDMRALLGFELAPTGDGERHQSRLGVFE
ncbi:MAG: DUF2797 domain-containing protein [Halodesulfurarchaeum sp.]